MPTHSTDKSRIERSVRKADAICRDKGLRFTALRRKVLEIIWANRTPIKAYDILDTLKGKSASAKPPTVYRTLDFLLENGLIHKLNSRNAYVGCPHPLEHGECYFLICEKCGRAEEHCDSDLNDAITRTIDKNKFRHTHTNLEIEGECRRCAGR